MSADDDETEHARAMAEIGARIEADNVALREHFFAEVPCYSEDEAIAKFGPEVADSDLAIFVEGNGGRQYPRFQFDEAGMQPNVAAAPLTLATEMSRWQIAFWFVSSNGRLDGKAPWEMLSDREQLTFAAEQENDVLG